MAITAMVPQRTPDDRPAVQLHLLDCGRIDIPDMALFSDTGEGAGERRIMPVPCFLVRHPAGTLLWDAGLNDEIAADPDGREVVGVRLHVQETLATQIAKLGLSPSQIDFVAFSHFHFDHTGNARYLDSATWLLNRRELEWLHGNPQPTGVTLETIRNLPHERLVLVDGDHDIFGDGSVRILSTPGHTPGHQSLLLELPESGTIILSGDLFHSRENHAKSLVPPINTSRAETLASMDRVARILRNTGGRLVIQHDPEDIAMLPRFPEALR